MATANRVIKNTFFLYIRIGVNIIVSLYTTRIILLSLGAVDFGIYNIIGGAIAMLGFLNGAMAMGTQRFMNYSEGQSDILNKKKIFNTSYLLHLLLSAIVGIILIILSFVFFNGLLDIPYSRIDAAKVVYISLILSTVFTVMSVPYDAVINSHENMLYYSVVGIIESLLKLIVAILCVNSALDKLMIYGVLMSLIPFITLTVLRMYSKKKYEECEINLKKYWDRGIAINMTSFAGWNFITSFSAIMTQYGLGIILNNFFGVLLNTAQGIANQVSSVLMSFSNNALRAINPIIVKSEGENNRYKMLYATTLACRISYFIFGLFAIPLIILAPNVLKLWLKNVPDWSIIFCQLQLIRIWTELLTFSTYQAISAEGNIKSYSIIRSIINILPLVIVPIAFYFGSAPYMLYIIWTIFWSLIGGIISVIYAHRLTGLSYHEFYKKVIIPGVLVTIIAFLPYLISIYNNASYLQNILCSAIGILIFFFGEWNFSLEKHERQSIRKIMLYKFLRNE